MKAVFGRGADQQACLPLGKLLRPGSTSSSSIATSGPAGWSYTGIYPAQRERTACVQFAKVLERCLTHYFGHVKVVYVPAYDSTIEDLEAMHPAAIVFACGAQGTNRLGLPGEDLKGVYAAKDFVYHYKLPALCLDGFFHR